MATVSRAAQPWYREPWPWILMSGPGIVVIAGLVTAWIAVTNQDALVADDYYKQGLAINRTLEKQHSAAALQQEAKVLFSDDGKRLRVYLSGAQRPAQLYLRLAHTTRSGVDQRVTLERNANDWYEGRLGALPVAGKWVVQIEDVAATWRITGIWKQGLESAVSLNAQ